jgi:predicted ATPase
MATTVPLRTDTEQAHGGTGRDRPDDRARDAAPPPYADGVSHAPDVIVRRVERAPEAAVDRSQWPATVPAVSALLDDGIDLSPLTVLVGENGSGTSTIVEALAMAYGMSAEGGSTGARHRTRVSESSLWSSLRLVRTPGSSRWGFFLRAETMHGFYTYLEEHPGGRDPDFHEMSHGESFLELLGRRMDGPGLFLLDEPESALSFTGCLGLAGLLHAVANRGDAQVVVATHSPLLASTPGARIVEVGEWGLRDAAWEDLALVGHWRSFLESPERYLRHLT